ncbi:MAG TPA: hypothetical protein P5228_07870 [Bacteroidales bacterium]|nr:hypothetical protein [Bacteroidales bacterium]HRZ49955.1 hypothetical protein [Bacteroidales bacterium]
MNRKILWWSGGALLLAALLLWYFTAFRKQTGYMSLVPEGASLVAIFNPAVLLEKAGNPDEWQNKTLSAGAEMPGKPLPLAGMLSHEGFQYIRKYIDPVKQGVAFHFRDKEASVWGMAIPLSGRVDAERVFKPSPGNAVTAARYKNYRLLISDLQAVAVSRDVMWILRIGHPKGTAGVRSTLEQFLSGSLAGSYFKDMDEKDIKVTEGADATIFGIPEAFSEEGPVPLTGIGMNEWLESWQADVTFEQGAVDLDFRFTPDKGIQPYLKWLVGRGISQESFPFHDRGNLLLVAALAADSNGFNAVRAAAPQWLDLGLLSGLSSDALLQHVAGNLVVSISHPDAPIGKMLGLVLNLHDDIGNPFSLLKPEVRISFDARSRQDAEALVAELMANRTLVADGKLYRATGNIPGIPSGVVTPLYLTIKDSGILISNRKEPLLGTDLRNPASSSPGAIAAPDASEGLYLFLNAERISGLMKGFTPEEGRGAIISLCRSVYAGGTPGKLHLKATLVQDDVNSLQLLLPWIVTTDK